MKFAVVLALSVSAWASSVDDVRRAALAGNLLEAERSARALQARSGDTPEFLFAWSWLARGALNSGNLAAAEKYAVETHEKAVKQLAKRPLDAEPYLPLALGAAIEVQSEIAARQGRRSEAVAFVNGELAKYANTSMAARLYKNLNLISLEGTRAPELDRVEWLGPRPLPLGSYRGRVVLLFFWAHWCGDCKAEAPVLAEIQRKYPQLAIVAPTRKYGYIAGGADASPQEELRYIDAVRQRFYPVLADIPVPVSERTFTRYGASTTPTLVLVGRNGLVRMYHPGLMTFEELDRSVAKSMHESPAPAAPRR